jgi:signal transduction histidine kinase
MKFRDLPIDKKVLLSNFMMIVIPVLLVLIAMAGTLILIASRTGSVSPAAMLSYIDNQVSNYQLQLMFDSLSEKVASDDKPLNNNDELMEICKNLEAMGFKIYITQNAEVYLTKGVTVGQIRSETDQITSESTQKSQQMFVRNSGGMAYHINVGNTAEIFIVNTSLNYPSDEYQTLESIEWFSKIALVAVGCTIIVIILLTGLILAKRLSKSILEPLKKLRDATIEIRNGNLDSPVQYISQDELGKVCEDFEDMRKRLKDAVVLRQTYEEGRKQLIAGISHDLATPLTSIKGYAKGFLDGIADTPEKREHYITMVYKTASGMEKLVEDLLLFSKLDMKQEIFNMKPMNLAEILADFCREMQPRLFLEDMDISFSNQCRGKTKVNIDGVQFGRVLTNLTENSIKYKKSGGRGKILVTLFENEFNKLELWFSDDGTGIFENESEIIFDSFYRCDSSRGRVPRGSGLGLAISKQIIQFMGGGIRAEGSPGKGLKIIIAFPKSKEDKSL